LEKNGGGYYVNHKYGFGLIDATTAVNNADSWINLGEQLSTTVHVDDNHVIPEGTDAYISVANVTKEFIIEHVSIHFVATHPKRGELAISIISPDGTESKLAEKHGDSGVNYNWTFGSIFHWGEKSNGIWKLKVLDVVTGKTGSLVSWDINIYGH